MARKEPRTLLLAPGQWKLVNNVRVENVSDKMKRVSVIVADVHTENEG